MYETRFEDTLVSLFVLCGIFGNIPFPWIHHNIVLFCDNTSLERSLQFSVCYGKMGCVNVTTTDRGGVVRPLVFNSFADPLLLMLFLAR